jgi:uncharacterized iron-regulated protein
MSRIVLVAAIILALVVEAQAYRSITRMGDRQHISLAQLTAAAGSSDLILIGEAHTNKVHHDIQLEMIRTFAGKLQLAIGLEMMQADHQQQLDDWTGGFLSEQAMQAVFVKNWTEDWQLYRDIFIFARDNHIPMIALNVPMAIVKKVSQQGFASLTPEERQDLPEGTSCDLSNPQILLLRKSFQEVGGHLGHGKIFSNFCEAQTVRNSGMAIHLARYLKSHPKRKIVVLTGILHAVKYAIPDQLERNGSKLSYTVILPETPAFTRDSTSVQEVDYLVEP